MKTILTKCVIPAALLGAGLLPLAAQAQRPFFGGEPPRGALHWSGDVDETTIVYVHDDQVHDRVVRGKSVDDERVDFVGRLPRRRAFVTLRDWNGRGDVRVVQQPRPGNDFTAAVRIHDPQPGDAPYRFTLVWRPLRDGDHDGGDHDGG